MAMLTVRNVPDPVHQALRERAARNGQSMDAEVRQIPEATVAPVDRVKLGSLLADIGRKARLTNDKAAIFDQIRDKSSAEPARFE